MIPAASSKLIEPLILVTLAGEKSLFLEVSVKGCKLFDTVNAVFQILNLTRSSKVVLNVYVL